MRPTTFHSTMGLATSGEVSRLPELPGRLGIGALIVCQAGFLFAFVAAKDPGSDSRCLGALAPPRDFPAGYGFSGQCAALFSVANVVDVFVDAEHAALLFAVIGDVLRRRCLTRDSGSSDLFPDVVEERVHPTERTDCWNTGGKPWIKDF